MPKDIINKILASNEFKNSLTYKNLLQYLFDAYQNGVVPKETSIAIDVFKKEAYDEASSNVRVYIHNLRKKIDAYYLNEGQNDSQRLVIPKGKYSIEFERISAINKSSKYRSSIAFPILIVLLGISLVMNIFIYYHKKQPGQKFANTKIWGEILKTNKTITIVVGDCFVFRYFVSR